MKIKDFFKYNKIAYAELYEENDYTHSFTNIRAFIKFFGDLDIDNFKLETRKDTYILKMYKKGLDKNTISLLNKAKDSYQTEEYKLPIQDVIFVLFILAVAIIIPTAFFAWILSIFVDYLFFENIIFGFIITIVMWSCILENH